MKSLFRLLVLVLMLAGWGLAALSLHVVRTPSSIALIPKQSLGITDTYVDTRLWTVDDVIVHAKLVKRIIETDKTDLLSHVANSDDPSMILTYLTDAVSRAAKVERKRDSAQTKPAADGKTAGVEHFLSQIFK
jgi:hypothetical protein